MSYKLQSYELQVPCGMIALIAQLLVACSYVARSYVACSFSTKLFHNQFVIYAYQPFKRKE